MFFLLAISSLTIATADSIVFNSNHAQQNAIENPQEKIAQTTASNSNSPKHFQIDLAEGIAINTTDLPQQEKQNDSTETPQGMHKTINLSERLEISVDDFGQNTIVALKQNSDRQTAMERIWNSDRIRFNSKYVVTDNPTWYEQTQTDHLSTVIGNQKQSLEQHFITDNLETNVKRVLDKIFLLQPTASNNSILQNEVASLFEISNSIKNDLIGITYDVVDTKNPTILLLLVPLVGYILIRSEEEKFEFHNLKQALSFCFVAILIVSTITAPISISSSYWGNAYAEEMNGNSTETLSEPVEPVPVNSDASNNSTSELSSNNGVITNATSDVVLVTNSTMLSTNENDDLGLNQSQTVIPDNSTAVSIPDNSTAVSIPDNSTAVSIPDNSTAVSIPDNSTAVLIPDNSTAVSIPDNSTADEIQQSIPNATQSWQFDSSPTAVDVELEDGVNGTSLKLEGEGYLTENVTSTIDLSGLSLSAWVKPDYSQGSPEFTVLSKENAFVLAINNNIPPQKVAKFAVFDGIKWNTVESVTTIEEQWTHLAATFGNSSISIYVNGNLESTLPITGIPTLAVNGQLKTTTIDSISSDADVVIGAYLSTKKGTIEAGNQFSGLIDNVNLYDSLLEPTQITELYNQNALSNQSNIDVTALELPVNATALEVPVNATTNSTQVSNFELEHDVIEINKPVTWIQNITLSNQSQSVVIELPADAQIIQVETSSGENVDLSTIQTTTKEEVIDNELALASLDLVPDMVQEEKPTELVIINETSTEYNIKFETPAPYTIEEDHSTSELYNKTVTVAHNSTLHYTDVKSYSDIPEDLVSQGIEFKLYWMINETKTDVTNDARFAVEFVDTNSNGIVDQMQWIVPKLSEQEFVIEAQITIINVQSYPVVGGTWEVRFTTTGTADLTITASNGTTWSDSNENNDLKFLSVKCGDQTINYQWIDGSVFIPNYSCTEISLETSKVLTSGSHHIMFRFGNDVEYAHNFATTEINHIYVEQTTRQTRTNTAYGNIAGMSVSSSFFTAGNKYLIMAVGQFDGSAIASNAQVQLVHGSTAFADSEMRKEPMVATTARYTWAYWTVWTAVAGEGIDAQFAAQAGTVGFDNGGIFVMNLSDDLTENTDWFVSEETSTVVHPVTPTWSSGASITFTPGTAGNDWLVMAKHRFLFDNIDVNGQFRLERSGEASSTFPLLTEEGEDASLADINMWMLFRVFNLGVASNTFTAQFNDDGTFVTGSQNDKTHTGVFALNLNKFRNIASTYTEAAVAISNVADYGTNVATTTITPTFAGDVFVLSEWNYDAIGTAEDVKGRMQIDNSDQPPTQTSDAYAQSRPSDGTNELPIMYLTVENLSAAAHTVDLDASVLPLSTGAGEAEERNIVAFTMQVQKDTKALTDSIDLPDPQLTKDGIFLRTKADSIALADQIAVQKIFTRSLSDSIALPDPTLAKQGTFLRTRADSIALPDPTLAKQGTFTRPKTDSIALADQIAKDGIFLRTKADSIALADQIAVQKFFGRFLTDSIALPDPTLAKQNAFARSFVEQVKLASSISFVQNGVTTMFMDSGGTAMITISSSMSMAFTLPTTASSGSATATPQSVSSPTVDGNTISFLGNIMKFTLTGSSCTDGCTITFTFTDTDLAAAGISNPSEAVIYRDSEEDGTFVALATILIDGAPSPYTVSATTFSTSFFGAGKAAAASGGGPAGGPSGGGGANGHRTGAGPSGTTAGFGGILEPVTPIIPPIDPAAPKIFDVRFQLGNGTKFSASETTNKYVNYQSMSVYAIVDTPTPIKRAELRFIKLGQELNEYSSVVMDVKPLQVSNTTYTISGTIPQRLMEGPAIVYWIHVLNDGIKVQDSDKYTIGVKPDYSVDGNLELDIQRNRAEGTTATPILYFTNEAGEPVYGTISLVVYGKTVYTLPAQLFDVGETGVKLEWKTPNIDQVTTYQVQAKAEFYGKSFETKTTINTFPATRTVSLSQPNTIEVITDQDGNTVATPSILYASFKDENNMRYRVIAPDGTCVIGGSEECLVTESTMELPGNFKSIIVGDQIYRVRYSGPANPLERFSITSIDPILGQWQAEIDLEDDLVPQAHAMKDAFFKVKYRAQPTPFVSEPAN